MTNHPRPQRIQLSRQGGLSMGRLGLAANGLPTQPVAYYSRWANPFTVERYGCPEALRLYCEYIADRHAEIRRELRGYNLACYCLPEEACHADVLLAIANAENDDLAAST